MALFKNITQLHFIQIIFPNISTFEVPFPKEMANYHPLQALLLILFCDKITEKLLKFFIFLNLFSIAIWLSALAVARKCGIVHFISILKSSDKCWEFAIVMNEMFPNCFQGSHGKKLLVELGDDFFMIFSSTNILFGLLVEFNHSIDHCLNPIVGNFVFLLVHWHLGHESLIFLLHVIWL